MSERTRELANELRRLQAVIDAKDSELASVKADRDAELRAMEVKLETIRAHTLEILAEKESRLVQFLREHNLDLPEPSIQWTCAECGGSHMAVYWGASKCVDCGWTSVSCTSSVSDTVVVEDGVVAES